MSVWRRLWPFVTPHIGRIAINLVQVACVAMLALVGPTAIGWVIDRVLGDGDWSFLLPGAGLVLGAAVLQGLLRFSQRYGAEIVAQRIIYDLRNRLYGHLQSQSFTFFDKARTGELMSRLTSDVETLRLALGMGVVNGLQHLATLTFLVVTMLAINWQLGLVALGVLLPLIHAVRGFDRVVRPTFVKVQERTADLTAAVQEHVSGVRVVRAFAREDSEEATFAHHNEQLQRTSVDSTRLSALYTNYMQFLTAAGLVAVLWLGGRLVAAGALSVGALVSFNLYLMQMQQPVRMLGWILNVWGRAHAGAGRLFEFLDTEPDVKDRPDAKPLNQVSGAVTFERVSFAYGEGRLVLEDIDIDLRPGQRLAIVGLTGSGKSTLAALIPRFYDVTAGRVLIDGHDVRDVTLDSLRRHVAVVFQDTFLFSTSLRENIAYGRPGASQAEIEAAAKAAQIHDFIVSLPDGYDTLVGERGVGLSGGQRQRMAIARALLQQAPVVILDESTASVDAETERRLHKAMDEVMQGRTAIVIAQRIATVQAADHIIVMEQGRIVERGTHEELLRRGGLYRRICELQFGLGKEVQAS